VHRYFSCILVYTTSNICRRVVWQGYKKGLFLVFWGTSILIFIVALLTYLPTTVYKHPFPPASSPACVVYFLTGWGGISVYSGFAFLYVNHLFTYLLAIYASFLRAVKLIFPFVNWIILWRFNFGAFYILYIFMHSE
jgi:hypothetical protein